MTLPKGWILIPPASEVTAAPYTGDQTGTWMANVNGHVAATGIQPQSDLNPAGQSPGVPVMTITAELAKKLAGPQPS